MTKSYLRRRSKRRAHDRGQAVTELVLAVLVVSILLRQVGSVLWTQWHYVGCLYHVFEATHARVVGGPAHRSVFSIRLSQQGVRKNGSIHGVANCGNRIEEVILPFLESAQW